MDLILTAYKDRGRELMRELAGLGLFWQTGFEDVVMGQVEDLHRFLDELEKREPESLSRLTPIRISFGFSPENVAEEFKKVATQFIDEINKNETFCVKITRRGLKGKFLAQDAAKDVGTHVHDLLEGKHGVRPKADLEDPDKALIFETMMKRCGAGLVSKEMRRKCRYLKLP